MTVAANYPHKNLQVLPAVARHLTIRYPEFRFRFVITVDQTAFTDVELDGVRESFMFLGPVPLQQCPWLYAQSDIMMLPTLLECFSASYAEAMVMRVPVVTSDLEFARGLCGSAAQYFDPASAEDIANVVHSVGTDDRLRQQLVEAGTQQLAKFDTPESRAEKYLQILESEMNRAKTATKTVNGNQA